MHADVHVFPLQLCHINNRIVSLAQRMSALEEHIEQLNCRMKDLEEKLEDNYLLLSRQAIDFHWWGHWSWFPDTFISPNCGELLCPIHICTWRVGVRVSTCERLSSPPRCISTYTHLTLCCQWSNEWSCTLHNQLWPSCLCETFCALFFTLFLVAIVCIHLLLQDMKILSLSNRCMCSQCFYTKFLFG